MQKNVTRKVGRVVALVGFCSLCVAQNALALVVAAPEIDAGSAASALSIAVGALTLVSEKLRRH